MTQSRMFALLEHSAHDSVHWDFMIEIPGRALLATWRLLQHPLAEDDIPAEPIADHPPHFLHYEGKLSGQLGNVRRLDRGEAVVERFEAGWLVAELAGDRLHGRFEIAAGADNRGWFRAIRGSE